MSTTEKYGDIIHLPHPVSEKHPRMPMLDRAAQFSPFAALTGHQAVLVEAAHYTELNSVLDEQQCHELDRKVNELLEQLEEHPMVQFTLFEEDRRKSRGNYREVKGIVIWFDD